MSRSHLLFAGLATLTGLLAWLEWPEPNDLMTLVRNRRADRAYVVPSAAQFTAFQALVEEIGRAAPGGEVPADVPGQVTALGYKLRVVGDVWILLEKASQRHGGGLYAWRTGSLSQEWVVQAPHSFFDLDTDVIATRLFESGRIRALYVATVHRYRAFEGETPESKSHPGDMAHNTNSFFQAATAAALSLPSPIVLQLHGMEDREDREEIVLSPGATEPDPAWYPAFSSRLKTALLPTVVARYPDETQVLGGTKNAQGRLLAGSPARFLHLEMSRTVRTQMVADPEMLRRLWTALVEAG